MCCSGADHMASGDLDRIESAFAEATLDSGLWSRALNLTEIGSFGTALLPLGGGRILKKKIPGVRGVVGSGRCLVGIVGGASRRAAQRNRARFARESMPLDLRPSTPTRCKKIAGREHTV